MRHKQPILILMKNNERSQYQSWPQKPQYNIYSYIYEKTTNKLYTKVALASGSRDVARIR